MSVWPIYCLNLREHVPRGGFPNYSFIPRHRFTVVITHTADDAKDFICGNVFFYFLSSASCVFIKTLPESAFFGSLSNEYLFNTRRRFRGPLLASAFVEETVGKAWLCPFR